MKNKNINKEEWQSILDKQEQISFFETPAWYTLWEHYFETISNAYLIDEHILLSVIKLSGAKGTVNFYNSSPAGTYSNFRSLDGPIEMDGAYFKKIQQATGVNFLRFSPFSNISFSENIESFSTDFTQYIDLTKLNTIDQDWSRNHKRLYQKSLNESLVISNTNNWNDWNQYIDLYKQFVRKKGNQSSSSYSEKLIKHIFDLDTAHRDLWIAKRDDEVIAGRVVFYTKDYAVEWHATSQALAHEVGANQLLIHNILSDLKSRDIMIYDFNPSGGNEGVVLFKEKFGALRRPAPVYKSYNRAQQIYLWLKNNEAI